jgi:uncharacterized damage-inducible protein DinB
MSRAQALLPEFDHEMANTRRMLERIPDEKLAFQPHPKSMSLAGLATHLAEIPKWAETILRQEVFDIAPSGATPPRPPALGSRAEILQAFADNVRSARETLASQSDAGLLKPWSLLKGGATVFTLPKLAVFRSFILSHSIHHRGQLSVYLRLNDVPLPPVYGSTADEQM